MVWGFIRSIIQNTVDMYNIIMDNKSIAGLCYLIFFAPKLLGKENDPLVSYHMKQGLGLLLAALIMQGAISIIGYWGGPQYMLAWAVRIILAFLVVTGWMNAMSGKSLPLPVIGKFSEKAL